MVDLFRAFRTATAAGVALLAAACVSSPPAGGPVVNAPTGVEGEWFDPNGIKSTFYSGNFETRTTDTNQKLAEGTYRQVSPTLVEISVRSLVRNTVNNVNCAMAGTTQLNCTSSTGQQFVLTRRVPAA